MQKLLLKHVICVIFMIVERGGEKMRKNTKGFTLIELLAVIVILAVIALIATPIIMNVINDAKTGANKDSAYGIIKAIETEIAQKMVDDTTYTAPTSCNIDSNGTKCGDIDIHYKGTKASGGTIYFTNGVATSTDAQRTTVIVGGTTYTMTTDGKF